MNIQAMKLRLLLLVALTLTFPALSPAADFRDVKWGMTPAQVKNIEQEKLIESDPDLLYYNAKVGGLKAYVVYQFLANKLVEGVYSFTETHSNKNFYIDDYKNIKSLLIKKYGKPQIDGSPWLDDLFRNDPNSWGTAIAMGHLIYVSEWKTEKTIIRLGLVGDNFEISHGIRYAARSAKNQIEKQQERNELEGL